LLKKYGDNRKKLLADLIELIQERSGFNRNMALFLNTNKSVTLQGIKLHLFYTGDSVIRYAQSSF
jgi:type I restriction enzyme R subunit